MFYIDSHCHINDEKYNDDLNDVINRMVDNNIKKIMLVSLSKDEYERALSINNKDIQIKRSLGIFPQDVDNIKDEEVFYKYYQGVDAIGEIGLDYHWGSDNKEKQKEFFIKQIELAIKLNKPIIVHSRDACMDTLDILRKYKCKGVLHCFSESAQTATILSKMGYYISLSGSITFMKKEKALSIVKAIPLDRLLIETDSPYLTPVPKRGTRNEPSNVIFVAKYISELLGMNLELLLEQINSNYENLFGK